jgi:hypothetical protein
MVLAYDELQEKHLLYLKTIIKLLLTFPTSGSFVYLIFHIIITSLFVGEIIRVYKPENEM